MWGGTVLGIHARMSRPVNWDQIGYVNTIPEIPLNPDCHVLSLGDSGFLHFFRVVSSDYGKPRIPY